MMTHKFGLPIAFAGLVGLALAGPSWAAGRSEDQEARALQGVPTTLTQAIATAEQHTGGRAFDAGADIERGVARITVETNGPQGVQTVIVDARNGAIVGTHPGGEAD